MLARLERTLPRGEPWRYEPKLDGFRGLLYRPPSGSVHLLSRNLKELSAAFPELLSAGQELPDGTLLDGEIVIADADERSNFTALQERLGLARRDAAGAASRSPAVLLALDLVREAGVDLTNDPLRLRRARLEALLAPPHADYGEFVQGEWRRANGQFGVKRTVVSVMPSGLEQRWSAEALSMVDVQSVS